MCGAAPTFLDRVLDNLPAEMHAALRYAVELAEASALVDGVPLDMTWTERHEP